MQKRTFCEIFSFRRQDCSQYGAVNSLKLVSQSESGQRGNLFLLSGHDDGQLILWSVVSSAEVILISIILDFENILWSIDFREDFRKKSKLNDIYQEGGWGQNLINFQYFPYFWSLFSLNCTEFIQFLLKSIIF